MIAENRFAHWRWNSERRAASIVIAGDIREGKNFNGVVLTPTTEETEQ